MDGRADAESTRRLLELRLANYRRNLTRCPDDDRHAFQALVRQAEREMAALTCAGGGPAGWWAHNGLGGRDAARAAV